MCMFKSVMPRTLFRRQTWVRGVTFSCIRAWFSWFSD
ncbi:hypothetical protein F383_26220 [Gossypium arboreum]|uniref:Uncharacterized protein n=1 Tax=Gossypium arboreum TaxID=29729 RepID=A0A0B0P4Y5_GOSAR|nr:hypothetical protein F383_26220 [Gossypium arboreum]